MSGIVSPIRGRPAAAPRLSLIGSAPDVTGELVAQVGPHWTNGITWVPESCLPNTDPNWWCPISPGTDGPDTDVDRPPAAIEYRPYIGWVGEECSTLGGAAADLEGRAQRGLAANESRILEKELWSGVAAQAALFPNAYLSQTSNADYLGSHGLVYALASLQEYLADMLNERGMIHATPRTAALWYAAGSIRREGNLLLDPFDNIIVAGQGYDGTGPGGEEVPASGDEQFAYATPIVQVARDTVYTVPTVLSEAIVVNSNDHRYRAERVLAAFFDVTCALGQVEVNLCSPCCEPSGS